MASKHGPSERLRFNGEAFRRYPESPEAGNRNYFRSQAGRYLHRLVWEHHHGPIPAGHHIHHVDDDPTNNDVANLECLSPRDHVRKHWTPERSRRSRERILAVGHLAAAWHSSPEGLAWHREHGRRAWANRVPVSRICEDCGDAYETKARQPAIKFCSNNCKSNARRRSGVDNEERICGFCDGVFSANKYSKSRCCSRACGKRLSRRKKGERIRPDG